MAVVAAVVAIMAMPALAAAQGKGPGNSLVPGTLFSQLAKEDVPTNAPGARVTRGQDVKAQCTPAGS